MLDRRRFILAAGSVLAASALGCSRFTPAGTPPATPAPGGVQPNAAGTQAPSTPAPVPEKPFRVALFSDVHLQPASYLDPAANNLKLKQAIADYAALKPDLWITTGDISDHGVSSEFAAYKEMIDPVAKPDRLLVTTGNHEFYDMETTDDVSVGRFTKAFGLTKPYSNRVVNGIHFVMLADEQWKTAPTNKDWCWITAEQLRWFEQVLADNRDLFTVVCMHQPLNDTVTGSQGPNAFGASNVGPELHQLRRKNPQVRLWFSGHTHRTPEATGQVVTQEQTTFVSVGSTAYLLGTAASGGHGRDAAASQSRMLEISRESVVVRTRDHTAGNWLEDLTYTLPRA